MTVRQLSGGAWRALLSSPQPGDALRIQQLAEDFRDVEQDRPDLGMLAGPTAPG